MKLYDLYRIAPQSFIFIRNEDGSLTEYNGGSDGKSKTVTFALATSYPMYESVIEVRVK